MTGPHSSQAKRIIRPNSHRGSCIAVLTSGGDSQGMNSAVRAVVRFGIYLGCRVYFVKEGYMGLVSGGKHIVEASWPSVTNIIHRGGTVIGSARCKEFRTHEGRLKAAKHLVQRSINNLVIIGGDGSLTGANIFRQEWPELLQELRDQRLVDSELLDKYDHLKIVGIVGSIDNDFCGTDMTIGTDSALHRIIEAIDCIIPTATSHQRSFILEVMGRHCGYLALVASIVCEADYVFIPEWPADSNWPEKLCEALSEGRDSGKRLNIIIVAEGAVDTSGSRITCEQIKKVVEDKMNMDTRITVLGHVQRGGAPSAFDRILGCRMGAEAVLALMDSEPETDPVVVSLAGNSAIRVPLMQCVMKTQAVAKAMEERDWDQALQLRGLAFQRNLDTYRLLHSNRPKVVEISNGLNFAVINIGSPCCGINAAVRSFVRKCIIKGHHPYAIHDGLDGLLRGNVEVMTWESVNGWAAMGGAHLGTKRSLPEGRLDGLAKKIKEYNFHGMLIIGGFDAYEAVLELAENRDKHPEFCIPMVVLPATISNNVPGTDFTLGADTALNEITEILDRIRQSAAGTKRRVFIVEVMGGYCGYLTTLAGLAAGCDAAYIHEEKFGMREMMHDLEVLVSKFECGRIERGIILRNEKANEDYTTQFIASLYKQEGAGVLTVRSNVLGHMQQGGSPSPFDRNLGTKMGLKAVHWLIEKTTDHSHDGKVFTNDEDSAVILGLRKRTYLFQPVQQLRHEADFKHRCSKHDWWIQMRSVLKILASHESSYYIEGELINVDDHFAEI